MLRNTPLFRFSSIIRTSWSSSQPNHPFGEWACAQGYKKIVTVAADYAFGYEQVGGFQKAFESCGGQIVQKIWPPLTTKDFGPYVPTIKRDADFSEAIDVIVEKVGPGPLANPLRGCWPATGCAGAVAAAERTGRW